jgi:hypothetical protein
MDVFENEVEGFFLGVLEIFKKLGDDAGLLRSEISIVVFFGEFFSLRVQNCF